MQVNGRLREVVEVPREAGPDEVQQLALAQERVRQHLDGQKVARLIYVPGKVLNIVTEA